MKKLFDTIKAFGEGMGTLIALLAFFGIASFAALVTVLKGWLPPVTAFYTTHRFTVGLAFGAIIAGLLVGLFWAYDIRFGTATRERKTKLAAKDRSAVLNEGYLFANAVDGLMTHIDPEREEHWSRFHEKVVAEKLAEAAGLEGVLKRMGIRMYMEPRPPGRLYELDLFRDRLSQLLPLLQHNLSEEIVRKSAEFEEDSRNRAKNFPDGHERLLRNYR